MPVDTLIEPTTRSRRKTGEVVLEKIPDILNKEYCGQEHQYRGNEICGGRCDADFMDNPHRHHCDKCGDYF